MLPKISALRSEIGNREEFVPNVAVVENKDASSDPLYLKIALDDQDFAIGTFEQLSISPGNQTAEGNLSRSRSQSPDQENSIRDNLYAQKQIAGYQTSEAFRLAQIDEHDESSILRHKGMDIDKDSNGPKEVSSPSEVKDPAYMPSENILQNQKHLSSQQLAGQKSRDDFPSQLMHSAQLATPLDGVSVSGKSSPGRGKSPKRSRANSKIGIKPRSRDHSATANEGNFRVEVAEPPEEEIMRPDTFPSIAELVKNTLRKEYKAVVQELEIEEEFNSLDIDVEETLLEDDLKTEEDDEGSEKDTLKSGPSESLALGGDKEAAIEADLISQLDKRPNDKLLHYRIGEFEIKKGEFSDRLKYHFVKVHKLDDRYKKHIVDQALGEIFFKDGNYKTALYFFRGACTHPQTDKFHTLVRIAQCYSKLDIYENAQTAYIAVNLHLCRLKMLRREERIVIICTTREPSCTLNRKNMPKLNTT